MSKDQLIREALSLSPNAIDYYVSQILADRFPKKALVEGGDGLFNVESYAQAQHCTITYKDVVYNQVLTMWRGREMMMGNMRPGIIHMSAGIVTGFGPQSEDVEEEIADRAKNAWFEVQWRNHTFDIITMRWMSSMGAPDYHYWILSESKETAKEFLAEVCRSDYGTEEGNIRNVFDRARKTAPCVLVFEDLDSLLNAQNRSFFLNELDGFASNIGVVTLATTNHPERLDPAILDRPSRFDRKYPFDLPEQAERQAYIALWNASLKPALRLSDAGMITLSELTEGFSFAYLKELFLSSMMRWIANEQQGTMEQTMSGQVHTLKEQMASANALAAVETPEETQMPPMFGPMMGRRMRIRGGM